MQAPARPDPSDARGVVQRLFVAAARRLGGASDLAAHLELRESELMAFLTGEAVPPEETLLRAVDLVLEDFHAIRSEFSEESWRALWGGGA